MFRKSSICLLLSTSLLTGCDGDAERRIEALTDELQQERVQVARLESQVAAKDMLFTAQKTLTDSMQGSLDKAIVSCAGASDKSELEAQFALMRTQCEGQINATNEAINKMVAGALIPKPGDEVTPSPVVPDPVALPPTDNPTSGIDPTLPANPSLGEDGPLNPIAPPPPDYGDDEDEGNDAFMKTAMLAGAYLACQYYSAGTCAFITAAVGLNLGLGAGDVKKQSEEAFNTLKERIGDEGIEMTGPDGKPMTLKVKNLPQLIDAQKRYEALPADERQNVCTVLAIYSEVDVIGQMLKSMGTPYFFKNAAMKTNSEKIAREVAPELLPYVRQIPVENDGKPVCG